MDPLLRKVKPVKHRSRRKPLSEEIRSMYKVLTVTLIALGIVTTVSYLYVNSLKPAKGYTLKQLQLNNESLQSEQRTLEHQVIEAQSFTNIQDYTQLDEMTEVNNDEFTFVDDSSYAQKN